MKAARHWTAWVSRRFLTGRRGGRGRLVFFFSVTLIGAGVATLITILSVMNGLQQGYIRSILEIGSYHLRWTPGHDSEAEDFPIPDILGVINSDPRVVLAAPFREGQTMLSGRRSRPQGALLRGVPDTLYEDDAALARLLDIVEGSFDVRDSRVVLGDELAVSLGVSAGDVLTALDLGLAGVTPSELRLTVSGVFQCGYRDYESSMAFVSLSTIENLFGSAVPEIGIKIRRLDADRQLLEHLEPLLSVYGGKLVSWREINSGFFGALRTEKVMMLLLLALIFVVVAVNIDHSLRRMAVERIEDLSILKAIGASPKEIRLIFLRQGLAIGGTGGLIGGVLGVLIGGNVDRILSAVTRLRYLLPGAAGGAFGAHPMDAFFSRSEVMASDVVVILLLAVGLSSAASLRAAYQAASRKPAEVLRSE